MAKQNLATVTNELITSYGNTAKNVITACHVGNKRAVSYLDQSWATAVRKAGTRLTADVRGNAIAGQKKVTAYYTKGVEVTTSNANLAVTKAVELAGKGVDQVAANAGRFEKSVGTTALTSLAVVTLPAAQAVVKVAAKLEVQSAVLAKKAAGSPVRARATTAKRAVVKKATRVSKTVSKVTAKVTKKVADKAAAIAA